jgi:hypothetical protein
VGTGLRRLLYLGPTRREDKQKQSCSGQSVIVRVICEITHCLKERGRASTLQDNLLLNNKPGYTQWCGVCPGFLVVRTTNNKEVIMKSKGFKLFKLTTVVDGDVLVWAKSVEDAARMLNVPANVVLYVPPVVAGSIKRAIVGDKLTVSLN